MGKLPDIKNNFPEWYQEVITEAELVDSSPTRGSVVIRPYGYALWENMKKELDRKIKLLGVENAYFPLLIPESFLKKEAKHVEGFSPEVAVVTHAGGKKLEEPYVIRPTSETMFYHMFSKWINSWRDLPLKINQWANVVRWEMRPRAFLRTTEFLWQEGHTAHTTCEEAKEMAVAALELYQDFAENHMAITVIAGVKTESERFAGADETFCIEGFMQDGKGLQMGTTHLLAKSFSDSFEVNFQDKDGVLQSARCSSWGVSTRLVGALIMAHGDQKGLVMPPKLAPIQVVIVPIYRSNDQQELVLGKAEEIRSLLESLQIRVIIDNDDQKTPGAKFYHWEVRGVPIRMELGPKDLEKSQAVLVSRIELEGQEKKLFVPIESLTERIPALLDTIQKSLFDKSKATRDSQWHQADSLDDFGKSMQKNNGIYQSGWCGQASCEEKLKEFQGTIRCVLEEKSHKICFSCSKSSISDILIAKAY
jgi:prolyl-tRNA synthetase